MHPNEPPLFYHIVCTQCGWRSSGLMTSLSREALRDLGLTESEGWDVIRKAAEGANRDHSGDN